MSVFAALAPQEPTAPEGAMQVRRALAHTLNQLENSLAMVRQMTERHGKAEIAAALGEDRTEVINLYKALKTLLEKNKPGEVCPTSSFERSIDSTGKLS